jgi:2-polyprenyl-3-methyl-5-hydroxy-6-metoxy-1,4-benzoquinol methylase
MKNSDLQRESWNSYYCSHRDQQADLWLRSYDREVSDGKGIRVLDIGCGVGLYILHYRDKNWEAIAIDYSRRSIV